MTPQLEEAARFLRLAKRDQAAFAALLNATAVDPAVACFYAQRQRLSTRIRTEGAGHRTC